MWCDLSVLLYNSLSLFLYIYTYTHTHCDLYKSCKCSFLVCLTEFFSLAELRNVLIFEKWDSILYSQMACEYLFTLWTHVQVGVFASCHYAVCVSSHCCSFDAKHVALPPSILPLISPFIATRADDLPTSLLHYLHNQILLLLYSVLVTLSTSRLSLSFSLWNTSTLKTTGRSHFLSMRQKIKELWHIAEPAQ